MGLSALIFFVGGATFNTIGMFINPASDTFHVSIGEASSLATIYLLSYYAAGPLVGWLLGFLNARIVMVTAGIIAGVSYFYAGNSQTFRTLEIALAIGGMGAGASTTAPSIAVAARYFRGEMGIAIGVLIAAGSLGAMIMPPIVGYVMTAVGWRSTLHDMGIAVIASVIPIMLFVVKVRAVTVQPASITTLLAGLLSRPFILLITSLGLCQLGVMGAYVIFVPFALSFDYSLADSALMFGLMNMICAVGCIAGGVAADRYNPRLVLLAGIVANGIAMLLPLGMWLRDLERPTMIAFVLLWGLVQGIPMQLGPVVLARIVDDGAFATLSGTLLLAVGLISSLGPLLGGTLQDQTHSYILAMLACGVVTLISAPLTLLFRADQALPHGSHSTRMGDAVGDSGPLAIQSEE